MFNNQYEGNIRLNLINNIFSVKIHKEIKRKRTAVPKDNPFSIDIYPRI